MSDINKVYDLLEKMYADLKQDISGVRNELHDTKKELKAKIQQNSNHIMRLENEFKDKF